MGGSVGGGVTISAPFWVAQLQVGGGRGDGVGFGEDI